VKRWLSDNGLELLFWLCVCTCGVLLGVLAFTGPHAATGGTP